MLEDYLETGDTHIAVCYLILFSCDLKCFFNNLFILNMNLKKIIFVKEIL